MGVALTLPLVAATASPVQAQQTVASATLSGRIEDQVGAAIVGATVSATREETGRTETAITDMPLLVGGVVNQNVQSLEVLDGFVDGLPAEI